MHACPKGNSEAQCFNVQHLQPQLERTLHTEDFCAIPKFPQGTTFTGGALSLPTGNIWRCLGTFWVVTIERVTLLLSILEHKGQLPKLGGKQ